MCETSVYLIRGLRFLHTDDRLTNHSTRRTMLRLASKMFVAAAVLTMVFGVACAFAA